jgi:RNA methyltransferase, TrmH family
LPDRPTGARTQAPSAGSEVTSVRSPRVKAARRLAKRAFRQRDRLFLVEGPQAVGEALASGAAVTELFVTAAASARHAALVDSAASAASAVSAASAGKSGAAVHVVSGEVMATLAQTATPQGLLAVCEFIDVPVSNLLEATLRLVVVLAHVRDPGNAGTVLRTADAAGADAVIFTDASVDPYNGKCVRASAGSLFHLPVVAGTRLDVAADLLRGAGLRILAADGRGRTSLDDVIAAGTLSSPTAWLFGNEAWGLPNELLSLADDSVAVPIYGRAESLNLATAAAVCLYASARAQQPGRRGRRAGLDSEARQPG